MTRRTKSIKLPTKRAINNMFRTIRNTKIWMISTVIALLGIILLSGIFIWAAHRNDDKAHFSLQVSAPSATVFTDSNSIELMPDGATTLPEPNNNRRLSSPEPVVISYEQTSGEYAPAMQMAINDSDIEKYVRITPFIRGTWTRQGYNRLAFTPEQAWPAETKYTIRINRDLINQDAHVDASRITFTTPAPIATPDSFALYPTSTDKSVVGVAVISFNYPIDTKKFADRVTLRLDGNNLDFTVKFDRFHRTAFITSTPVAITSAPQIMRLKINRVPSADGDAMTQKITANTTIESADNIFKISSITTTVADDTDNLPQQLILIDMTTAAADNISDYVTAYLLPRDKAGEDTDAPHKWMADEITKDVLKESKKLALSQVDFTNPTGVYQYAFSYDVSENEDRFIYADVAPGMQSASGFALKNGGTRIMQVPYPTRMVSIAGSGALLAMGGEQKLGITARGGAAAAYVNLYKVKSTEINHLISQSYGIFSSVDFKSWSFGAYDMSVVFRKTIPFSNTSMKAVNYASVDLGDYLDRTRNDKTGIFIVQTGTSQSSTDYNDMRLILLTDLGIVRKVNLDESSTVFVSSLTNGGPAADTEIYVLGRNGNSVWAGRTDDGGRVEIPALPWREYKQEKQPVAIVARNGNDVSFIPYDAYDRQVEYSKFDVDGTYASNVSLKAYVFSDRGIYRPGESVIVGAIIKSRTFKAPAGAPVRMEIRDSRGRVVFSKTMSLTSDGMLDVKYALGDTAPTGEYYAQVYSVGAKNQTQDILGSTEFRVEEFVPDNLKIRATITGADTDGWVAPENLSAQISLQNLFGTPATDKRITAHATLTPAQFKFANFPGYIFTPNFIPNSGLATVTANRAISQDLPDTTTDENGNATMPITFENATDLAGTYNLTLQIQGFEGGSGRGVQTVATSRVSNSKYLVGYLTNSDLSYINRGTTRSVNLVAVDHTGTATAAADLKLRIIKRENLTSLIKDYSDTYKYQTITRDKIILTQSITIPSDGTNVNLDTENSGTYYLQITDAADKILANIEYFVAGSENTTMATDTQASLQIKLNASEYAPGDEIAVSITAPYAGSGLITIERDKVYAYKWFNAQTTTSVQTITLPNNFEGTGYINVSFVRDINSRDIFTTPYAYAVAPFSADVARRTIGIKLSTPETVTDGKLKIEYETDKSAKLMIFATNTGILQVAKYKTPNPIAHFFQKAALQVNTYQILSLLLPEYKILREFAKTGGGDYDDMDGGNAGIANPFGRRTEAPVAFYSEIISAAANQPGHITFDIPEYFNGEIRIYAVASGTDSAGAAAATSHVQSPIIVSANAPLFVAPNDKFSLNAVVTNLTNTENADEINVSAKTDGNISITGDDTATLNVANGTDGLWTVDIAASDAPGAAEVSVTATMPDVATRGATATLSVRPATAFTTHITSGATDANNTTIRIKDIKLYEQFSQRKLYVSTNADAFIRPLIEYLNHYDWTCSEQLTSRALPYALIGASNISGITATDAASRISAATDMLKNRQNDDGSFALWNSYDVTRNNANDSNTAYITAWVAQFLTIARDNGFDVPREMLSRATDYLRTYAATGIQSEFDANVHAFAIYVITRNEFVTTSYIDLFEEYANQNIKDWPAKLMGAYIATSYKLMHQDDRAADLIGKYQPSPRKIFESVGDFDNNVANDSIYNYLRTHYFNVAAQAPSAAIAEYIDSGNYSAYTSAAVIMGLSGNTDKNADAKISATANGAALENTASKSGFVANIPAGTTKIELQSNTPVFWSVTQQGYPLTATPTDNGIEIVREYYNAAGEQITTGTIGETVTVKITARTRGNTSAVSNAVIVDLMPGGFIADTDSMNGQYDFAQFREDRAVIYATLDRTPSEFTYTAQLGSAGTFAIPAIHAESMYNPAINATGRGGIFTVSNVSDK